MRAFEILILATLFMALLSRSGRVEKKAIMDELYPRGCHTIRSGPSGY